MERQDAIRVLDPSGGKVTPIGVGAVMDTRTGCMQSCCADHRDLQLRNTIPRDRNP